MTAAPHYPALVLNADFTPMNIHPLSVWSFERTLRNHLKGRIIEVEHYDVTLKSPSFEYRPPSVIALKRYVKKPQNVAFTRMNIFLRDDFRCQYCNEKFAAKDLTFDHVIPRSRGGDTSYENIVAACVPCNTRKADSMDMRPLRTPKAPTAKELAKARPPRENLHESWLDHLYWLSHLEQ